MTTRHQIITYSLRERIADGTYPVGSKLPAIPDLMDEFSVARDTVRDAVTRLAREGLVTPRRGVGTVVRDTAPIVLIYRPDAAAQVWTRDDTRIDHVIQSEWESADSDIAARLEVPEGTRVLHRTRHQGQGQQTVQIHEQWVIATLVEAIRVTTGDDLADRHAVQSMDLFSQMRAIGDAPTTVTEVITARVPDQDEAAILELPPVVVVLTWCRVTRDERGTPLETSTFVAAADRISLSYTVPV